MSHASRAIDPVLNISCPVCAKPPHEIVPVIEGGEPWGFPFFGHWKRTPLRVVGYRWIYCGHVADPGRPIWYLDDERRKHGAWIGHDENPEIWIFRKKRAARDAKLAADIQRGMNQLIERAANAR